MISWRKIEKSLEKVPDPELGINIVDLGLINKIDSGDDFIRVEFVLTYPGCPMGPEIAQNITDVLKEDFRLEKVEAVEVWDPPWFPDRMTEEARFTMGYPI
jgi:metal-sulfur cluster biosynthetic enzyme